MREIVYRGHGINLPLDEEIIIILNPPASSEPLKLDCA